MYDETIHRHVKKKEQEKRTFYDLEEAIKFRNRAQEDKYEARRKQVEVKKQGATVMDAAKAHYEYMQKQMKEGKIAESYVEQLRIQMKHFEKFFNGKRTTYVKSIDTQQIEDVLQEYELQ